MLRDCEVRPAMTDTVTEESKDLQAMLEQPLPVIEKAVADLTWKTGRVIARERALFREFDRSWSEWEQWRERCVEAVKAGDTDMLRKALARRDECRQTAAELRSKCEIVCRANCAMQRRLRELGAWLADKKQGLADKKQGLADKKQGLAGPAGSER